jgi:hypothetical protein
LTPNSPGAGTFTTQGSSKGSKNTNQTNNPKPISSPNSNPADRNSDTLLKALGLALAAGTVIIGAIVAAIGSKGSPKAPTPTGGKFRPIKSEINNGPVVIPEWAYEGELPSEEGVKGKAGNGNEGEGTKGGIKNVYDSIKAAPKYPEDFKSAQDGTKTYNIKNNKLSSQLREIEEGKWKKVYKDGYSGNQKISIHYFQSPSGRVFDVDLKFGKWSNPSSR